VSTRLSNQNFDGVNYSLQGGTPVVFITLNVSADVTFQSQAPPFQNQNPEFSLFLAGTCELPHGHLYSAGLYAPGAQAQIQNGIATNLSGGTLSINLELPFQTFPTSATVDVVITQN
jgi:hypothetical protein